MTIDHSDEVGWPAPAPRVSRVLSQKQKAAMALNRMLKERERRPPHPYFPACVCDWCVLRRKVAAE